MSTNRVRPGSSIAELLQALSAAPAKSKGTAASRQESTSSDRSRARDLSVLRHDLALLTAGVDLDSEPAVRALRRPVVRRILLWEFGESFLEHPDFRDALARVEKAMDTDPAIPRGFLTMLKQVRSGQPA
jgi:hypothetical protein